MAGDKGFFARREYKKNQMYTTLIASRKEFSQVKAENIIKFYGNIPAQNHIYKDYGESESFSLDPKWLEEEMARLKDLFYEEKLLRDTGAKLICGIDEVGRGPMAGPVVACAIVFDEFKFLPGLNDSKKLNRKLREILCEAICSSSLGFAIGQASASEIDSLNIHRASLLAMKRAIEMLPLKPDMILVDGRFPIPEITYPQRTYIKGDARIFSICAASIVAKVHRDNLMCEYDRKFPGYGFSDHKGYCTKKHIYAIQTQGVCPIHRRSFKPLRDLEILTEQMSLI